MKHNAPRPWVLASLLLAPVVPLAADDEPILRMRLEDPQPPDKNRFGISYRAAFNITARFENVAGPGRGPGGRRGPGPATGGVDHVYDDGYNRVDSNGNRDGLTWNWGYENSSQIVGDTVVMRSTSASRIDTGTIDEDIQHGVELTYNRELGRSQENDWSWGLEGALGWTGIDITDHRPLGGGVRTISDAYNLGLIPPPAPYNGTFQGPGPLIEDTPNRTIVFDPNGTLILGHRQFDGDLFSFRFGPYIDIPIDENWTLSFSAGVAIGLVEGEFRFNQLELAGDTRARRTGSASDSDILFGAYMSALFRVAITERCGLFFGGQYLGLSDYTAKAGGQTLEIEFARTASFVAGVTFTF